ncbi:hypothetical protein RJ55_05021 [Drechmeria coniospora]|nr:hypothetical protein RJ55_05021 [Drechmeria coniospora]
MASSSTSKTVDDTHPSGSLAPSLSFGHRRGSTSTNSVTDKEQLAQALDKIHTSASRCDTLTTFNDFTTPPEGAPASESRGTAGEMVQHGLSGLYSRFREVVGAVSPTTASKEPVFENADNLPKKTADGHSSRLSISSANRGETSHTTMAISSLPAPMTDMSSSAGLTTTTDSRSQMPPSSKATSISLMTGQKSTTSSRQSLPTNATSAVVAADPTIAPPLSIRRDNSRSTIQTEESGGQGSSRRSLSRAELHTRLPTVDTTMSLYDIKDARDDISSIGDIGDKGLSPIKTSAPGGSAQSQNSHARSVSNASSMAPPDTERRTPTVISRISRSISPRYPGSRESSLDRGTAEVSPINTTAHSSLHHDTFTEDPYLYKGQSGNVHIMGTITGEDRASDQMSAHLGKMRMQVLSREFWMKDDTVKECFLCQAPFTAFRRKHHCRTCGCIFDSKCTTVVSGEKFGVQGSLRVCKNCLEVISRRVDGSASEDSADERSFLPKIFGPKQSKGSGSTSQPTVREPDPTMVSEGSEDARPVSTPMMAIPATRRVKDPNSSSSILEINAPQLSRPGSSRSLKSLSASRPPSSAGHKRHHSKHGVMSRYKAPADDRAPFRKRIEEDNARKPKFPAFHDDNIIDPDLADYMSDDSSGDEQMNSIFQTMGTSETHPASYENEKSGFASYAGARKNRHKAGEKSISGMSYVSRGVYDDTNGPGSLLSHKRSARRRNLSNVSGSVHHLGSPRPKSVVYKGPSTSSEMLFPLDSSLPGTQLTRNDSLRRGRAPKVQLNQSSLKHVNKLLRQLLTDAEIPSPAAWQRSLVPILLHLTDQVTPDIAKGEDMDIRHYVKLKRIPGSKPSKTSYVSGVVFTKNLALKSMSRTILNPRIVLVTFPIEYQRHQQQHFMSLQAVMEQEKEFLRVVVQRITNLRPHVLLAQKGISGVAMQYLSEANISVAYNVKDTVIEAVARCAEAEIIESIDMLALPVRVGRCSAFKVRTFFNELYVSRKKTYIFISGCRPDLGCTIALRGASNVLLGKVKNIMEFMVYVVYNSKLESSLLRDESVETPEEAGESSMSNSVQVLPDGQRSLSLTSATDSRSGPTTIVNQPSSESEPPSQTAVESSTISGEDETEVANLPTPATERLKLVSLHEHHSHASHESQVPDDVPMPTFYSDMVAKYETKILSASPYVKFKQPHLLMKAREQERRLLYLKRLRDQDAVEEDSEKTDPQKFLLIKPEMVEKIGQQAPRQIMEILHAVHDAEYDKALYNYQTQTRQWETYIQGNLDLFDPYSHQNIVVLYSVICTETKIPCIEPTIIAINFYDEQHVDTGMDPDCTLGQYIVDLAYSKNDICNSNGCERKMAEHHRTYVHDQYRITVFVEYFPNTAPRAPELGDGITMWTYCKLCKKDSKEMAMSEATFKYSFGKYLELLYWGRGLKMKDAVQCSHDHQQDHVRYFTFGDSRIRIHWDPIDLLEIVVPRARITWKVVNDLKLKNEIYTKMEERWSKFMASVRARLKSIRIDSVLPEKAESCKAEVERLTKRAQEEQPKMVRQLQSIYVNSKYYEVVPFNSLVRDMLEKAGDWDQAFAKFEADFLGDKDMRQLTMMQLKKMFTDNESKESLSSTEGTGPSTEGDDRTSQPFTESEDKSTQPTEYTGTTAASTASSKLGDEREMDEKLAMDEDGRIETPAECAVERAEPLDLSASPTALSSSPSKVLPPLIDSNGSSRRATSPRPSVSSTTMGRSPTESSLPDQSLSEKVEEMRRERTVQTGQAAERADVPAEAYKAAPECPARRSGTNVSPPMVRTISHPARVLPRSQSMGKSGVKDAKGGLETHSEQASDVSIKGDKKLSDRLGLNALKSRSKATASGIPRLVHKKRETKVSNLARHFEQLSREFEKERIRDRKERAASLRQPRARLPRTSTKAIVQVYDDVNEAFEEPAGPAEQTAEGQKAGFAAAHAASEPPQSDTPPEKMAVKEAKPESQQSEDRDDGSNSNASQVASDDDGGASDGEEATVSDDILPGIEELADALEPSTEIPLELPKHQKTSLMKYLTNFWAERSASGWPPLEYPVNSTDHIFVDSDIIVREDEPSSVIALALSSDDYKAKLANIRNEAQQMMQRENESAETEPKSLPMSDFGDGMVDEAELKKSLLRTMGTHLRYQFKEGAAVMTCKIFYAEQFDALRRKCGVAERVVESLSRCMKWDSRGGKTKSVFLKTLDDRLVLKSLSPIETSAFVQFAPGYFTIMAEALFHDLPSVIAKMLGFFQVIIKNPSTGTETKLDLLITENLFYDRSPTRIFDLKGSMRNRKIQSTGEQNEVLLDENMVEYIYESPLFAREHSKKLLRASVWNDTLFLARQNVMDYSLMIAVDEERKELVVGIIDCIRTYTWDKKLESWIKDRGFAGGNRNRPTVTSPKEYKSRFRAAMARYILQAPNCWHLFNNPQYPVYSGRARFEEAEG